MYFCSLNDEKVGIIKVMIKVKVKVKVGMIKVMVIRAVF